MEGKPCCCGRRSSAYRTTGDDVVDLLERYGDAALILAGGTFVRGLEA
jgi:hypothetical protein